MRALSDACEQHSSTSEINGQPLRAGGGQSSSAVEAEVVVIGLDGVRVGDRVVPEAQIVRREPAMVDRAVRHVCAGEQYRWLMRVNAQRARIGRRFGGRRTGRLADYAACRTMLVDDPCRGVRRERI